MLGMAREWALYWAWPGSGLYIGNGPGVGSILGMAREWALYWAWPGSGLYIEHGLGVGSILGMALRRPERALI